MKTPDEIISKAMEYKPIAKYVGFSGGRDSLAVTHWMMNNIPNCEVFHCNTGIGVEKTREFVRETCKKYGWPLTEIRAKEDCGQDYDEIVKENGFPGAFSHRFMWVKLKERAIKLLVKRAKIGHHRRSKVLIATGIRHDESVRRMRGADGEINHLGSLVWVSPIYYWSAKDRDDYIENHNLPINPISKLLGMSGECLCGAYAHKGEKELIRIVDPETAERIDRLEQECLKRGFTWGWEGSPPPGGHNPDQGDMWMPFCVGCEK